MIDTYLWKYTIFDKRKLGSRSTGCIKKMNRFEIALSFGKQLLVSSFFMYIASLGTYIYGRIMKKFSQTQIL